MHVLYARFFSYSSFQQEKQEKVSFRTNNGGLRKGWVFSFWERGVEEDVLKWNRMVTGKVVVVDRWLLR